MFKTLYVRMIFYFILAVFIGVIVAYASAILLFEDSNAREVSRTLTNKGKQIIDLYESSGSADRIAYLENAARLASVKIELTDPNAKRQTRINWSDNGNYCDCDTSAKLTWDPYQLELFEASEDDGSSNQILIALTIALIVGSLVMLAFVRRLVKPVKRVTEAAKQLATGNFNVKLAGSRQDEIGVLSRAMNDMAVELGRLDHERRDFVANVSHEFQSPLTIIKGFSSMLLKGTLDKEEQRRSLQAMIEESERLAKLSDNLLRLASLESGRYVLSITRFDLAEQIRRTVLAFEVIWSKKQLNVEFEASPLVVFADEELLNQVWVNLMSNAVKFTDNGGCILIELKRVEGQAEIRFFDDGIPIACADETKIFDGFYKADRARNRNIEGNGLGLSIAKKIVEFHRGTIEVVSEEGGGKSFVVRLPIREENV